MSSNFAAIQQRLEQRRGHLIERRDRARSDLRRAGGALSADFAEQAVEVQNDEALAAIERAAQVELAEIDEAIERLQGGKYGVCKICGDSIEAARLLAAPQSVRCVACNKGTHAH